MVDRSPTGAETQNAERLINTSKERGIKEDIMRMSAKEYLEANRATMTPEQITEWETKQREEEDQERIEAESMKDAEELQQQQTEAQEPEMQMSPEEIIAETEKRLNEVLEKDKRGERLTNEEAQMLVLYGEVQKAEEFVKKNWDRKAQSELSKQQLDLELQQAVQEEYLELKKKDPSKILRNELGPKQEGIIVGRSLFKGLMFILSTHWSMKRGYTAMIKVWKSRGVEVLFLNKSYKYVEFWSKNERGEDQISICKVRHLNYRWMGSSIPIAFAVEGHIEAYDFFTEVKDEYTQELVQKMNLIYYWSGVLKSKETFPDQKEPDFWSKYKLLIIIAAIVVLIIAGVAYMQYQQVQDLKAQIQLLNDGLGLAKVIASDTNARIISGGVFR